METAGVQSSIRPLRNEIETQCDSTRPRDKYDITVELITATKKADVPNVLFISSAGADLAERDKQPHLRQFIDLETLVMAAKGDGSTSTGHAPCIIRAGFYAEILLVGFELAQLASQSLGVKVQFEDISEAEAKKVLKAQHDSDPSELQYLLEYYSLVQEGKTNYISTSAFVNVTGGHPQQLEDFFKVYAKSFISKGNGDGGHATKKRKT
ncbi:hypothetical protein DPSP01_014168 [Paraphaeosphaeria sporulosa]